jgi:hypothetical protein
MSSCREANLDSSARFAVHEFIKCYSFNLEVSNFYKSMSVCAMYFENNKDDFKNIELYVYNNTFILNIRSLKNNWFSTNSRDLNLIPGKQLPKQN